MKRCVGCLLGMALFFTLFTFAAAARSYTLPLVEVDVDILENGDALCRQRVTYAFDGEFNGALQYIGLDQTMGVENLSVEIESAAGLVQAKEEAGGEPSTFTTETAGDLLSIKTYSPSEDETKVFIYTYTLKGAAVRYSDTAQFNHALIGENWEVPIGSAVLTVTLPEGATRETVRVFAHGPLNGQSQKVDDRTSRFTADSLPANTFVEVNLLFPAELLPTAVRSYDRAVLAEVLAKEQRLADEANEQREQARLREERLEAARGVVRVGTAVVAVGYLGYFILLLIRNSKKPRPAFDGEYYRELPGEYPPAVAGYFMNSPRAAQPRDIMATLLDLVRRKVLVMREEQQDRRFGTSTDYRFSRGEAAESERLLPVERSLLRWLLETVGDGVSFSMQEVKSYAKDSGEHRNRFSHSYSDWTAEVYAEAQNYGLFAVRSFRETGFLVMRYVLLVLAAAGSIFAAIFTQRLQELLLLPLLIATAFAAADSGLSPHGEEQRLKWRAFKRFLKHFSRLDKAELPAVRVWEHYLVYAISLGVAKEVIRQLPKVYTEQQVNVILTPYFYGGYASFASFDRCVSAMGTTLSSAVVAASVSSSGSGAGGGFSGGSSGGGGHGGGGGAF